MYTTYSYLPIRRHLSFKQYSNQHLFYYMSSTVYLYTKAVQVNPIIYCTVYKRLIQLMSLRLQAQRTSVFSSVNKCQQRLSVMRTKLIGQVGFLGIYSDQPTSSPIVGI